MVVKVLESEKKKFKNSNFSEHDSLDKCDRTEETTRDWRNSQEKRNKKNETRTSLVKELLKENVDAMSAANLKTYGTGKEESEVCSPFKPKKEASNNNQDKGKGLSPSADKIVTGKGGWKKLAREKAKAQEVDMINQSPRVGKKRIKDIEALIRA